MVGGGLDEAGGEKALGRARRVLRQNGLDVSVEGVGVLRAVELRQKEQFLAGEVLRAAGEESGEGFEQGVVSG